MSFHYVAIALLCAAFFWHFRNGGRAYAVSALARDRDDGLNRLTDEGHTVLWLGVVGFFALSAIILLVPPSPIWLESALGGAFILLAIADFAIQKGRKSGGYFAAAVGALILAGLIL
ncbi:hypothetical protein OAS19_02615 [Altererythrobacter sp.]|nr:hypothetical protein [Altererythrobacter sp.]